MSFLKRAVRLYKVSKIIFEDRRIRFSTSVSIMNSTLLIVKMDAIGDYILFRNFLKYIRESKQYSEYKITLCGNVLWKDLCEYCDGGMVDEYIWIDRKQFVSDPIYRKNILLEVHNMGFETAISPTRSRYIEIDDAIINATGATHKISRQGDLSNIPKLLARLSKKIYSNLLPEPQGVIFEFATNKAFIEQLLGIRIDMNLPQLDNQGRKTQNYIIIVPGSGEKIKQWPIEYFSEVVKYINSKFDYSFYIVGGESDFEIAKELQTKCEGIQIENFCGKTSLSELHVLIKNAVCVISNDTGMVHISAALKVQTICLINGIHFGRFGPYPNNATWMHFIYPYPIERRLETEFDIMVESFAHSTDCNVNMIIPDRVIKEVECLDI